jgi:hypothetical protein
VILNLINAAAGIAYLALLALGLYRSRRTASLADMDRAIAYFMLAALAQFVSAGIALVQVDRYGWPLVGVQVALLAGIVVLIHLTVKSADRMEAAR